jgi:hypothetical protein
VLWIGHDNTFTRFQPVSTETDYEAVLAARDLGIDTVCLLTVGKYGGHFGMLPIPVVWHSKANVVYNLRIIDVQSGRLLLDAVRSRSSGGLYAVKTAASLGPTFTEDLQDVLSAPKLQDDELADVSRASFPSS